MRSTKRRNKHKSVTSASIHLKCKMYPIYNCILINELQKCLCWKSGKVVSVVISRVRNRLETAPQCSAVGSSLQSRSGQIVESLLRHTPDSQCRTTYATTNATVPFRFSCFMTSKNICCLQVNLAVVHFMMKRHIYVLHWLGAVFFALLRGRAACPLNLQWHSTREWVQTETDERKLATIK